MIYKSNPHFNLDFGKSKCKSHMFYKIWNILDRSIRMQYQTIGTLSDKRKSIKPQQNHN